MAMSRNFSPGVDPNWGAPQGGYITIGGALPGMGGTPLGKTKQNGGQARPGGATSSQMSIGPRKPPFGLPGQPMQQTEGAPPKMDSMSMRLKNSPFGQPNVFRPAATTMMKKNFGL